MNLNVRGLGELGGALPLLALAFRLIHHSTLKDTRPAAESL
jgi:hypothetical protein